MRHLKKKVTLDRKVGPRRALLKNLVASLVLYEKIRTTEAKASATRSIAEKYITKAKLNTLAARRALIALLPDDNAAKKLMEVLGPRYADRKGGYTRIIKIGGRKGDGAKEVILELV